MKMAFILTLAGLLGILFCFVYKPNFGKILKWLAGIAGVLAVISIITLMGAWFFVICCFCFGLGMASLIASVSLLRD
jgi:hypothetical protein